MKLSAAGVLAALAGGRVVGYTPLARAEAAPTTFAPGVYTATGEGRNAPLTVEVELGEDRIERVEVVESLETPYVATAALEGIPAQIVAYQSLGVDTMTGATFTSAAIIAAVEDCVRQAGGDVEALRAVPAAEKVESTVELECEVAVLGAGASGLIAAAAAAQAGAQSVVVFEKTSGFGGNLSASGGYLEYPVAPEEIRADFNEGYANQFDLIMRKAADAGVDQALLDSIRADYDAYYAAGATKCFDSEDFFAVSDALNTGRTVEDSRQVCRNERALAEWLTENGFHWSTCFTIAGISWPRYSTSVDAPAQGRAFCDVYQGAVDGEGLPVTMLTATPAEELIVEDGRVAGVKGTCDDGTTYVVRASRGVVIATGGYSGNPDLIRTYDETWNFAPDQAIPTENNYGHTGDGLVMALGAGAATAGMGNTMLMPYSVPGLYSLHHLVGDSGNCLLVNKEAKRYVDECSDRYTLSGAIMAQTDEVVYIVSDARAGAGGVNGFGMPMDVILSRGYAYEGQTVEEAARLAGLDPDALAETVALYNSYAESGVDPDFGRESFNADSPVVNPPFYVCPNTWAAHITMGGVVTDDSYAVLDEQGAAVPGLYAVGEMVCMHGGISVMSDGLLAARAMFA